jgi:hypothetical protein
MYKIIKNIFISIDKFLINLSLISYYSNKIYDLHKMGKHKLANKLSLKLINEIQKK